MKSFLHWFASEQRHTHKKRNQLFVWVVCARAEKCVQNSPNRACRWNNNFDESRWQIGLLWNFNGNRRKKTGGGVEWAIENNKRSRGVRFGRQWKSVPAFVNIRVNAWVNHKRAFVLPWWIIIALYLLSPEQWLCVCEARKWWRTHPKRILICTFFSICYGFDVRKMREHLRVTSAAI